MLRHCLRLGLLSSLPLACFDPTNTSGASGTDESGPSGGSSTTDVSADGGPSGDPSTDPTMDPTADPTMDPTVDPTEDPSGDGSSTDAHGSSDDGGDPSSDAGSDATMGSSEDGAPSCAGQCAPAVPAGWQGPVVMFAGDDPPDCPGDFPTVVHAAQHSGLVIGSASCGCECGDAVGASCGSATLREEGNDCLMAVPSPETHALAANACTAVFVGSGAWSLTAPALDVGGASCAPQASESIATPTWATEVRSCEAASAGTCDDGACIPETPAEHSLCIWQAGDAPCPAGPWTESTTTYAAFTDGRECSACTCSTPSGSCGGYAEMANNGCGVVWNGDLSAGTCSEFPSTSHATYVPDMEASCSPSGGALQGSVSTSGAVTYCCM